jgi:hypothetical protein
MGFSIGGFNPFNINTYTKPAKQIAKVVVGGVEKVADDFLGIDDSGGIVGSTKKIGEKIEDGLREAVDEVDKALENPYVRMAISIAYPPAAPYLNAYAKLDSGEKLNAADIAAIAASAGQDFGAFEAASIDPEVVNNIKKGVQVATADNPGEAFLMTFGTDVAEQTGFTEAFDSTVADTFGQGTLDVLKQNEDYIVDSARFASGNISEQELVAKYGAGAVDYATSGTALEDYNQYLTDAINVGVGNTTLEETIANRYGEDIVNYLGAETENERAVGLGGLTTATQLAMGVDPAQAAYAGTKRAYDEGARLEDLSFVPQQIANVNLGLNDIVTNLGIDFPELQTKGYDLPSLADIGIDLNNFNLTAPDILNLDMSLPEVATNYNLNVGNIDFSGYKPTDLGVDVGEWGKFQELGVNVGDLDLGDYNLPELADINLDLNIPELDALLQQAGQPPSEYASLGMDSDLLSEFEITGAQDDAEVFPMARKLLSAQLT